MNHRPDWQPATALWKGYHPETAPYRFQAKTIATARQWQKKVRPLLARQLGFQDDPIVPLRPQRLERVDRGDFIREKIVIQTAPQTAMPVYLLTPKNARGPLPVVMAFHGHGYGVKDIVGLWEDGSERLEPDGYHKDFAIALCREGFAVAAPEISCFGERQTNFSHLDRLLGQYPPTSCVHSSLLAFHLGKSPLGIRVRDARRLVDYLETRTGWDTKRLGAMGISGGGLHTLFSAAIDTRIQASVISGYFSTFRDSVLAMQHCPCNIIPGLHAFGEMHDIAALVAPRSMLIESGDRDPIFPIRAVKAGTNQARRHYEIFGAGSEVATDYFRGRHQINGPKAYAFLRSRLGLPVS